MKDYKYVQYGCGWCAPHLWRNFDASPVLRFERIPLIGRLYTKNQERFPENVDYGDIINGLPILEASCEAVYCSHILEHLALNDLRIALRNTYKILKPGGVFRFVMPDLEYYINIYNNDSSSEAAPTFLRSTLLGSENRRRGLKGLLSSWLGNSNHLWMWDYKSIRVELQKTGFTHIRRASYGDSSKTVFHDVEEIRRWENCLGVECEK